MKASAAMVLVILLAGCASTQPQPVGAEWCDQVARLASDGEFKPAVDEMSALEKKGIVCSENVVVAVEEARARLAEADALVRSAQGKRQLGDMNGASSDLERALAVYPKYFWTEKQLRDVERTLAADQSEAELQLRPRFDAQLTQSRAAEARGDVIEASRLTSEIFEDAPFDPDSRSELVEYSRLLGLKLFSEGELKKPEICGSRRWRSNPPMRRSATICRRSTRG